MSELTIDRIRAAASRIVGTARRTDLLSCASLDRIAGCRVLAKAEVFQRSGSFKFRGAYNRLVQLSNEEKRAGVVCYSSGNHGAAIALAAALVGTPATVIVPEDASEAKVAAITAYGAEIRTYDPRLEDREAIAESLADVTGAVLIPPFEDYEVMAGQGTLGLEFVEDAGDLDTIVVPVGGGGLLAGVGTAIASALPRCRVVGVEPADADDTRRSWLSGQRERGGESSTIADGLRTAIPGSLTFPINQQILDDVVVVSDQAIVAAMRFCFERMKIVLEPSGAVAAAALLSGAVKNRGGPVGIVLSGGNVAAARFAELIAAAPSR